MFLKNEDKIIGKKYIIWQKISVSEKCVFQWKIGFWVDNRRLKTNPTLVNWLSITNVSCWNNCLRQVLRHVLEDVSVWACVSVRACVRLNKFFCCLVFHADRTCTYMTSNTQFLRVKESVNNAYEKSVPLSEPKIIHNIEWFYWISDHIVC